MSNPAVSQKVDFSSTPISTTSTIVLSPAAQAASATTRATSLVGLDPDLLQGGQYDGRPFRVRMSGVAYGSASENITATLYLNNSTNTDLVTFSSDISVLATGTMATGGAAWVSWSLSAQCLWNSTGTALTGNTTGRLTFYPEAGGNISIPGTSSVKVATAVIGNSGTAIVTTLANLQFFLVALTGTADATSLIKCRVQIEDIC